MEEKRTDLLALLLRPELPNVQKELPTAEYRVKRLSEAVRYVREALTVCPYITGAAAEVVGFDGSTLRMRVSLTTVYGEASIHV